MGLQDLTIFTCYLKSIIKLPAAFKFFEIKVNLVLFSNEMNGLLIEEAD